MVATAVLNGVLDPLRLSCSRPVPADKAFLFHVRVAISMFSCSMYNGGGGAYLYSLSSKGSKGKDSAPQRTHDDNVEAAKTTKKVQATTALQK